MKRTTFSILFFIKRKKLLKDNNAPVYMKITVNGKSTEVSLKRGINPQLWDTGRNKAKGKSKESQGLNEYLSSVRGQVFIHHRELQETGKVITSKNLCNAFLGIGEKQWTIISLFTEHNTNMSKLVNKEIAAPTLQKFKTALKHISNFCKDQYRVDDVSISEVDHRFITKFEFYLKTEIGCQHNSAMNHIKALKKVIKIALANAYITRDPFSNYHITTKAVNRECLSEYEIRKLIEKDLPVERLSLVRDLFLFQCFTGLAFNDLKKLSQKHLQIGIDGNKWIYINRGKTGVPCRIPLLSVPIHLLEKYKGHPKCQNEKILLPVPSNQKMNAYLKEITAICGIDKELHTHLARHTYATTVTLSNGVPIETVSKLLGHTKLQTTQIYAKIMDQKICDDMKGVQSKFS